MGVNVCIVSDGSCIVSLSDGHPMGFWWERAITQLFCGVSSIARNEVSHQMSMVACRQRLVVVFVYSIPTPWSFVFRIISNSDRYKIGIRISNIVNMQMSGSRSAVTSILKRICFFQHKLHTESTKMHLLI